MWNHPVWKPPINTEVTLLLSKNTRALLNNKRNNDDYLFDVECEEIHMPLLNSQIAHLISLESMFALLKLRVKRSKK